MQRLLRTGVIQAKLRVGQPNDSYEQEADRVADAVMHTRDPAQENKSSCPACATGATPCPKCAAGENGVVQRKDMATDVRSSAASAPDNLLPSSGRGRQLDPETRAFFEPRFGYDLSRVRVHTDGDAVRKSRALNAQAFTHQRDIYFGAGKSPGRNALTAHELTHVVQQTGGSRLNKAHVPNIQRDVEVRPPGRGEASAFDRRQELIDRMNTLSAAIQYRLDGRRIAYDVIDEAGLTDFDRRMRDLIDRAEVVPMRLITSAGLVDGQPLWVDSLQEGYVDLDDLVASDDLSFKLNLIHLLVERFAVRNYEARIGMASVGAEWGRAHPIGLEAEAEHLRSLIGDPTIRFVYEETRPNGTDVFAYRSAEGYWVFHVFRRGGRRVRGGLVFVQTRDGRRLTIDQLRAERAAAVPAVP